MRSNRLWSSFTVLGTALSVAPSVASAQGAATDVQVRKPNVLLLIDTSGSMEGTLSGGTSPSVADKARWTTLVETLTGSIQNLSIDASTNTFVASNGCRPVANLDAGISNSLSTYGASELLGPYAWPKENGNPKDKDAVAFCQTGATDGARCFDPGLWGSAPLCRQGSAADEYHQLADGLIDDFADDLRFGLASFDSLDTVPWNHLTYWMVGRPLGWQNSAPYGDYQCNTLTDGRLCDIANSQLFGTFDSVNPQWSYWHASNGNSWLNTNRGAYTSDEHRVAWLNWFFPIGFTLVWGNFGGNTMDAGFRNSRALPTQGRLVGFGPKDYSNVNSIPSNYQIDCNSENTCTEEHNRMVQQAILGLESNLVHSTPLAAMMRDAYEFIVNDDTTRGVHLPHARNQDIGAESELFSEIGPQTDPYFTDATSPCRSTSVVLVTDGEPFNDLRARAATYARDLLQDADVQTFVVGVGLSQATWDPPGATPVTSVSCDALTATDLGVNQICEPSGLTNWRFADVSPHNSALNAAQRTSIRACCTLLQTAVEGGTNKAFFPANAAELKKNFSEIINSISKTPVSRTLPVFAGVTASFSSMSTNAPAVSYEIRSSMNVAGDGTTLWRGNIERVRYACDGSDNPILQTIEESRGDDFGKNLLADTTMKRRFFTAIVDEGENMIGSIRRASVNASDELFEDDEERGDWRYPDNAAGLVWGTSTGMVEVDDIRTAFNGAWGGTNDDLEEVLDPSNAHCTDIGAGGNKPNCAAWSTLWFAGHPDPDGGAGTATPSRDPDSSQCDGICSPLGAIYRTVPVFVPPPQITDSDDQNFARDRGTVSDSFYERHGGRPTMLYSQTIDGQLHAFVVSKNQSTSGPPYGDVTVADTLENNELWTFIPPAVMPLIDEAMVANPRVLDGQLAWSNVVYERAANAVDGGTDPNFDANVTLWDYQTVIVGCNGNGDAEEGFCYALEITNPLEPKFLWQLSTSGDDDGEPDEPLFGKHVPGAAITHVRIDDGTADRVVAVAVIPGGHPGGTAPGGHTNRRSNNGDFWGDPSRAPRTRVRDWSGDQPARSLTFVELRTGRILARMAADHDDDSPDLRDEVLIDEDGSEGNTLFDSPLTGIPAPYPAGLGAVAQRIYVGDADGTLWRVELNGSNIQDWEAHIAFDGYNKQGAESTLDDAWVPAGSGADARLGLGSTSDNDAATLGEPIQTAPTLSLDERGNVVVSFATGDQEAFNTYSTGMVNVLVSFVDEYDLSKSEVIQKKGTKYQAKIEADRGVEFAWKDGGGVTGPLNLFDGQLFFAYFAPSSATNTCTLGTGGICGAHYVDRVSFAPSGRPKPTGVFGNNPDDFCQPFADGEVVFGLAVNQVQSCAITTTTFTDPWLAGSYTAMTEANPGRYELVYQTGQNGAAPTGGGVTKRSALPLPRPKSRTQIRSFVRVAEAE